MVNSASPIKKITGGVVSSNESHFPTESPWVKCPSRDSGGSRSENFCQSAPIPC